MTSSSTSNTQLSQQDIIANVQTTISEIFGNLFSSINNSIYSMLDNVTFISPENAINTELISIFESEKFNIIILSNIIYFAFIIIYLVKVLISFYSGQELKQLPYNYIIKYIFIGIVQNFSLFLCEKIISFNYLISQYLEQLGDYLFNAPISFTSLINNLNSIISSSSKFDMFSLDGLITSTISFGFISLLISYIVRIILVKLLIILSPFAILCLIDSSLSDYFKNWLKFFISLLLIQNLIVLILYMPFILQINSQDSTYSKMLVIGLIYSLTKVNEFLKEFLGGFNLSTTLHNSYMFANRLIKR